MSLKEGLSCTSATLVFRITLCLLGTSSPPLPSKMLSHYFCLKTALFNATVTLPSNMLAWQPCRFHPPWPPYCAISEVDVSILYNCDKYLFDYNQQKTKHIRLLFNTHFTDAGHFRHKQLTLGTVLKMFVTWLGKKNKVGTNNKNNPDQTQYNKCRKCKVWA